MSGPEILVPIAFIFTVGSVVIARTRIGEAIADRIRGGAGGDLRAEVDHLRADVEHVRAELAETQERLDFAERLLARPADAGRQQEG